MTRILGLCLVAAAVLSAQRFEEVSIKPGDPNARGSNSTGNPGRFSATNITVKQLISRAYNIEPFRIEGGPKWIESARFTIAAKLEDADTHPKDREERMKILQAALQNMLAERFQLTTHRESKTVPCLALVVAKGGPKMREVDSKDGSDWSSNRGVMTANRISMGELAAQIAGIVQGPVIDSTGLKGAYEFKLQWSPESGLTEAKAEPSTVPTIYTALPEQLALKLESTKAPIEMLVVDRAEKPTEN